MFSRDELKRGSKLKLLLLIVSLFVFSNSYGKSCLINEVVRTSETPYSVIKEKVDYILIGKVVAKEHLVSQLIDEAEVLKTSRVKIKVDEWLKGEGAEFTVVGGERDGTNCSCVYEFEVGASYILFGSKRGGIKTVFCQYIAMQNTGEYLAAIEQIKANN